MTRRAVAVFGSSQTEPGSTAWAEAEEVGSRLARAGLAVITGGYGGTMEAVSKGAATVGGEVIGVTAPSLFTGRSGANSYVTREIQAPSLTGRIGIITSEAGGVIALPGSIGTAAEFVIAWNLNHISRRNTGRRLPTVAVGRGWRELVVLMTEQLNAVGGDVHTVETADQAVDWLLAQPEIHHA